MNREKKKRKQGIWLIPLLLILVLAAGTFVYLKQYYPAEHTALAVLTESDQEIEIREIRNQQICFIPKQIEAGLIFYPGGKVQYEAYAPLMKACARQGILCVLLHMNCNLAVLDKNAADHVQEQFPEVKRWVIGGHSLGGVMAASYLAGHQTEYEGVVLLGAYETEDFSQTDLRALSIYGSEDYVMNRKSYEKYHDNLPADLTEVILEGGCHSYFGSYGMQKGDGIPVLTREEQITQTAKLIASWLTEATSSKNHSI